MAYDSSGDGGGDLVRCLQRQHVATVEQHLQRGRGPGVHHGVGVAQRGEAVGRAGQYGDRPFEAGQRGGVIHRQEGAGEARAHHGRAGDEQVARKLQVGAHRAAAHRAPHEPMAAAAAQQPLDPGRPHHDGRWRRPAGGRARGRRTRWPPWPPRRRARGRGEARRPRRPGSSCRPWSGRPAPRRAGRGP